jgi:RimJ/RimL family protein N-acetyltransferase
MVTSSLSSASEVVLRGVVGSDLPILFEYRHDPVATEMAAVPLVNRDEFMEQWAKILADDAVIKKTILFKGQVAGYIACFEKSGQRLVGYWLGRDLWGKGIATSALLQFVSEIRTRPLYAHVAKHNNASIRVLEKCGFTLSDEDKAPTCDGGATVDEFVYTLRAGPVTNER